ncbi:MAG TPA: AcvB/VirJ family lysyl-phosphatidylglycerol hydrolase [Gemmatimonadaceae bacterium]|nr:AcvB/VirJ family lysyl-phosphatidylglycerol hydrolase [Gemmatimonadaceae bacterium]
MLMMVAAATLLFSNTRAAQDTADVRGLPVREIPASRTGPGSDVLVVFITGDGGWAALDKQVAAALAEHGAATVGLDSRAYLQIRRTPDDLGRDVARIARHYSDAWHRKRIVLAGYSRGADLMPFALTRFPPELRQRVVLTAMLGLATFAGFEFHWQDIVRTVHRPGDRQTLPELERLRGTRMLCVYGVEEERSGCVAAPAGLMQTVGLKGKHHFDGNYGALADLIWKAVPQ